MHIKNNSQQRINEATFVEIPIFAYIDCWARLPTLESVLVLFSLPLFLGANPLVFVSYHFAHNISLIRTRPSIWKTENDAVKEPNVTKHVRDANIRRHNRKKSLFIASALGIAYG